MSYNQPKLLVFLPISLLIGILYSPINSPLRSVDYIEALGFKECRLQVVYTEEPLSTGPNLASQSSVSSQGLGWEKKHKDRLLYLTPESSRVMAFVAIFRGFGAIVLNQLLGSK